MYYILVTVSICVADVENTMFTRGTCFWV